MKVKEAYQKAFKELMEKGYNTYAVQPFSEDVYAGHVFITKKATWNSRLKVVYKVYKTGSRYLLTKNDKREFLEKYA